MPSSAPTPPPQSSPTSSPTSGKKPAKDSALSSLVEVEKLVQLGLLIPAATIIGWLIGVGLDRVLHQHWIYIAGLLLGATAGFVQMFRTVLQNIKE